MTATKPPAILTENIPAELRMLPQWVLWKYELRDEKMTKVPYQAGGDKAMSNNPRTWTTFEKALAALPGFDGLGVMFGNGLAGIDLDHHIEGGKVSEYAQDIVDRIGSYTELSPSGTGLHILFWGGLPEGGRKDDSKGIEMYSVGRFFTITGKHFMGTPVNVKERSAEVAALHAETFPEKKTQAQPKPSQPNDIDDITLLEKARAANNGGKFDSLYSGNWKAYYSSQSEADLALCSMLAFWTGGDAARTDRLFRSSGLMRDKWDKRHSGKGATYGEMTLEKGLAQTEYYTPRERSESIMPDFQPSDEYFDQLQEPGEEVLEPPAGAQPRNTNPDRFKLHTAAEALEPQEPTRWIVKDLIEAGNVYAFIGDAGSGKTYMLLDAGVSIANGEKQWGDFEIKENCPILLIDEESGDRRIKRRLRYLMNGHSATGDIPLYYVSLARFDIRNPEDVNSLYGLIQQTKAGVVIVDAFMDVMPGADENSVKDVQPGMLALGMVAKTTDCAIFLIHHTNKAGGYRGSSAIKGSVDGMFIIEKKQDSPVVEVQTEKGRDIKAARFTMIAHFHTNPLGELEQVYFTPADPKQREPHYSKPEKYVLRYFEDHDQAEIAAIMAAADTCSDQSARQAVYSLTAKGVLHRIDEGGPGTKAIYAMKDSGRGE